MPEQHSGKRGQSMDYKLVISEHADGYIVILRVLIFCWKMS